MRRLLALALVVAAGCGDRLADAGYRGVPLATLRGSMVLAPGAEVDGPVRLALAWYPQWLAAEGAGEAAAVAIVTEDVEAEATFPVDFRFRVYQPPPPEALAELGEGLEGRGAFGILLAYQDLDGDRRLDPIAADGAPVDRILASSLLGDPSAAFALVYVDRPQPEGTGFVPGFNLVQAVNDEAAAVVPLDTRTRLALTGGGPIYDAFVCEAGWLTFMFLDVCGLSGGGGTPAELAVSGRVALDGARLQVLLEVASDDGPLEDAAVTVNGRAVPYRPDRGAYVLEEDGTTLVRPGATVVVAATGAGASVGRVFTMPGELALVAPAEHAAVSRAGDVVVAFTASAGATAYFAGYDAPPAGAATLAEPGALSVTVSAAGAPVGEATAFVEARIEPGDGRAFVTTALVRRRPFFLVE